MKRIILLSFFTALFTMSNLFASNSLNDPASISGTILDEVSGEPLIGATITIEGTSFGVTTNLEGEYAIHNIKPGTYTLVFRYIGYEELDMPNVTLTSGQMVELHVEMTPKSIVGGEIVVTAQARGQMAAINQERAAAGITNIVSSDKIKEVPDVNAAESIGRLPGVSLQRSGGEGDKVVIRGLSPQFSIIEIDGVRMTGAGMDRGVGLSTVSSEMLDGIELSKSLTADKDADAIGGIVNLRTATAANGFHAGGMARVGYNGLDKELADYKIAASVSNRFFENKFGALLNITNERVNRSSHRMNSAYSQDGTLQVDNYYDYYVDGTDHANYGNESYLMKSDNANVEIQKSIRYRTNGNLALDYKNDFMNIRFNNIYSHMTMDNENRNNQYRFSNNDFRSLSNKITPTEQMQSHSLNGVFKILTTELDVTYAYSKTKKEEFINRYEIQDKFPLKEEFGGVIPGQNTYFMQPEDIINKYYNVGVMGEPSFRNNQRDTINRQDVTNVVNLNWSIPFSVSPNFTGKIKIGGKYSNKKRRSDKSRIENRYFAGGIGTDRRNIMYGLYPDMVTYEDLTGGDETGIPGVNYIIPDYDWGDVLDGQYDLGWGPDLPYLTETHNGYYGLNSDVSLYDRDAIESAKDDYEVSEVLTAGYIMAELNIGRKLMLLPGVRYELMQTTYESSYSIEDPFAPDGIKIGYPVAVSVDDRENAHFFPSLNIKYEATDWIDIRGAYYKSTSRPNFSKLSPGITSDQDLEDMDAYNPFLEPSTVQNYDLGVSFFTAKLGLFTANVFYKEMDQLMYELPRYQPKWFDQLVVGEGEGEIPASLYESLQKPRALYPEEFFDPTKNAKMDDYPVNNPHKAIIKGVELSWQTNFWYLPGFWKGFVLDLNYSYIQSEYEVPYIDFIQIHDPAFPETVPVFIDLPIYASEKTVMPDQPDMIFNARLGYEYRGFSTRLSFRYETERQLEFDRIPERNLDNKYTAPLFRMDLNVAQKLGKGFTLSLDVMNLTNAMDEKYLTSYNPRTSQYVNYRTNLEHYGLTAQLGIRYNY